MSGKLNNERFAIMSANYEAKQEVLKEAVAMLRNEIKTQDDKTSKYGCVCRKKTIHEN